MTKTLQAIFEQSLTHRAEHSCGSYPYEHADVLNILLKVLNAHNVLELGTGLGYTAAVMASNNPTVHIDTIDKDSSHMEMAKKNWDELQITPQITPYTEKAEYVLPQLTKQYDLIFFDGYVPSMKFLIQFEKLLKKGGVLVTANMFLRDEKGGKYMRALQKARKWQVATFSDTTIAYKLF